MTAAKFCIFSQFRDLGLGLEFQVPLHQLAQFFPVFVPHVDEFDAASIGTDVADHRSEIDLSQARANFQFDRITNTQFAW